MTVGQHQDVRGLEVAVHDALLVRRVDRARDLLEERERRGQAAERVPRGLRGFPPLRAIEAARPRRASSVSPSMKGITTKTRSPSITTSITGQIRSWPRRPRIAASRFSRSSARAERASPGLAVLITSFRPVSGCRASRSRPIPPEGISPVTSYVPIRAGGPAWSAASGVRVPRASAAEVRADRVRRAWKELRVMVGREALPRGEVLEHAAREGDVIVVVVGRWVHDLAITGTPGYQRPETP